MIWHSSAAAAAVVLLYVHELLKLITDKVVIIIGLYVARCIRSSAKLWWR